MISRENHRQSLFRLLILVGVSIVLLFLPIAVDPQTSSSGPSAFCHETDGTFTTCEDGNMEWSDVPFIQENNSHLYADQASMTIVYERTAVD